MFSLSKRKSLSQQAAIIKRTQGVLTTHASNLNEKQKDSGFELNAMMRPTNQTSMGVGNLPVTLDMSPTLSGFLFNKEEKNLVDIYKDIYYYDIIAGTAADLLSTLPFSDFSLRGLDTKMERPYMESLERLNIHTLMPEISIDYLVFGTFIGSLVFNKDKKIFVDIIPHDFKHCTIKDFPFYGVDPIINVNMPKDVVSILREDSERVNQIKANYGTSLINRLCEGQIELEPLSTLYIPRRTMTSAEGTSYFRRILPIYFMEKNLYRGSLAESIKRLRSILHITAGDLDWEPSPEDLKFISELFINADNDPIGAIVATRNGVNTNEIRCVSGSTRIATNQGLMQIKDMVEHDPDDTDENTNFHTNILVKGVDGNFCAVENWWYQGYKRTYTITTDSGFSLTATENHKIITILDGEYHALPISDVVTYANWALIELSGKNNTDSLNTKIHRIPEYSNYKAKQDNDTIKFPSVVCSDFGYVLGLIIRNGNFLNDSLTCYGSKSEMKKFSAGILNVFSLDVAIETVDVNDIYTPYKVSVCSSSLIGFMKFIGLLQYTANQKDYYKKLPECVLLAPKTAQLEFLLAYFTGDFTVNTTAQNMVALGAEKEIQIILANFGIYQNIELTLTNSDLKKLTKKLLETKESRCFHCNTDDTGIPVAIIENFLYSRTVRVERKTNSKIFIDDFGNEVSIKNSDISKWAKYSEKTKFIPYSKILNGDFTKILDILERISPKIITTIFLLADRRPKFERIVSIVYGKKEHVYDLTMSSSSAPVFVANGMLVKNSGGDFWKIEDMWNSTIPAKLKALNLSESFINGESSVQTMEGSMSGFVEQLRSYRGMLTRKIFYDKLFPLISLTNEFYIDEAARVEAQKLRSKRNVDLSTLLYQLQDTSSLAIPQVLWEKNLKPEGDQNYLEILKSMTEAGVPVPIRTMAAAGGIKLERVLKEQEEDLVTRKKIIEYNKKIAELLPKKPQGGDDEYEGYASALAAAYSDLPEEHKQNLLKSLPTRSALLNSQKRPSFIKRFENQGEELLHGTTRTGKKKHIIRQTHAQTEVNGRIAQAMKNLQKDGKLL